MPIIDLLDFRGGYHTDSPSELMAPNELLAATNCQWRKGIKKRNGIQVYDADDWSSLNGLKGGIRVYLNATWYTILALEDDAGGDDYVHFYSGATTAFTVISAGFHFTKGYNVSFAYIADHVVAVNGVDKPAVIYYSSGLQIANLEAYDVRTRDNVNWWAGQWDNSETNPFVDDTADAQDTGADDFAIMTVDGTEDNGCYIACDYPFNKVTFTSAQQAAGSPVIGYTYWNGTAWTALTVTTTPAWTAAAGDRVLEFDLPLNSDGTLAWLAYNIDNTTEGVTNRFIIRIQFTTHPTSTFSCDSLTVQHTQYLTQILLNERPHLVYAHGSQLFLASGNTINMSPPNTVKGWREGQVEYFESGGQIIKDMVSFRNALIVFKENTIYALDVSNYLDPVRSAPLSQVGTTASRSAINCGPFVAFVSADGIYAFDGDSSKRISKHIRTDYDALTKAGTKLTEKNTPCAVFYQNEYWVSFPANSTVLTFDPDTMSVDEVGDAKVSFFKFTSYKVHQFLYLKGDYDSGLLLGLQDVLAADGGPQLMQCDTGAYDVLSGTTQTAITMTMQTKYHALQSPHSINYLGRLKPKLDRPSSSVGRHHTLTLLSEDGTVDEDVTLDVPQGSGYYSEDISVPYVLDGKNFAIKLVHDELTSAGLISLSFMMEERRF